MSLLLPEEERVWLGTFFGSPNCLQWGDLINGRALPAWENQVIPWLQLLARQDPDLPVVLPRFGSNGPDAWYGVANDARRAAQLAQELEGFLGPSYTEFDGQPAVLTDGDPCEAALGQRFGPYVFRFRPVVERDVPKIQRMLSIYRGLLARRPPIPNRVRRPIGQIRADFDRALLVGDERRADALLEEFELCGRLSAEQQKCLTIRRHAGLGYWEIIARDQGLIHSVMDLALPPQTMVDVVGALHRIYVEPVETAEGIEEVLQVFRLHVARPYGRLFRDRKGIRQPRILRSFLLYELSNQESDRERCSKILNDYSPEADGHALAVAWLRTRPPKPSAPPRDDDEVLDQAQEAFLEGNFPAAFELFARTLPHARAVLGILRCAQKLGTRGAAVRALEMVADVEVEVVREQKTRALIETLHELAAVETVAPVDRDWLTWATWVEQGAPGPQALEVLEQAVHRWTVEDQRRHPDRIAALATLIGNADWHGQEVFRQALPKIYEFFVESLQRPMREFVPLYTVLMTVTAWSDGASADELELASLLAEAALTAGADGAQYKELVGLIDDLLTANNSFTALDWALAITELLALFPSSDPERRLRLFMRVADLASRNAHRLSPTHRAILHLLSQDYRTQVVIPNPTPADDPSMESAHATFAGIVVIYSLTTAAAQRAKEVLRQLLPCARIELNDDQVATPRLTQLARAADLFVFAWKSSKHQAYYAIKDARDGRSLLMPTGKGTGSIVTAVLDAVAQR